jgi:Zn-dependent protease
VHVTFLLLLGWIGLSGYADTRSALAVFVSTLEVLGLFGLVVLHEYGHALTARHFGIRTRNITLYPIGGVAALEGMPSRPREQLLVALAGPAVNFALAALIAGVALVLGRPLAGLMQLGAGETPILSLLFTANVLMGSFNLLPALPMDGGRVLRALLAMRLSARSATRIAVAVAKVVAVLMGMYAFKTGHTLLAVIAIVVWLGSTAEARLAAARPRANDRPRSWPPDASYPTEVLRVPLGSPPKDGTDRASGGPAFSGIQVDGLRIELVQTEDGPRMRYSRAR